METLRQSILSLPAELFSLDTIQIRPIMDDYDLWYAVVDCQLAAGQEQYVNPAGFSIGRAYLQPENHLPCIIWKDATRIGYIVLRRWHTGEANSWSYYLDQDYQGFGYGRTAAKLAVQILTAAEPNVPVKLSTEHSNKKAQKLYSSIGFQHLGETDGDDLVFEFTEVSYDLS